MSKFFSSIRPADVQQPAASPSTETAAQGTEQATTMLPPYVPQGAASQGGATPATAGVVPPPDGPVYSMRPPESTTRFELDAESTLAEKVKMASEEAQQAAQEIVQKRVRVAVQRTKTADSAAQPARRLRDPSPRVTRSQPRQTFDPVRAAQAGLLNVAWAWQEAGSPIRAIHAYMQLLERYPDTPAAAAAVADLVQLSENLAQQGQFHTALAIYDQLEALL